MKGFEAFCLTVGLLAAAPAYATDTPLPRRNQASAEPLAGVETAIGELRTARNYRLRTFITRPAGTRHRLPAVYFVQWLSCDTVEIGRTEDGWTQMVRALVHDSGLVVMRLDKAGVGDSEGGPCSGLDYETELAQHRQALRSLYQNAWVDPDRVYVFGASMGANFAPLVAAGNPLRGIAVWGGGASSWFERQLGFERRALERAGTSGAAIDERMRLLSRFYSAMLLDRLTPAQIAARNPELGAAWALVSGSDGSTQFGRSIAFHQQAQARRWAAAWEALDVPVLALFGEYDWYESPQSVELIGAIVNRRHPGRAQVRFLPGIDHHFMRFRSPEDALSDRGGVPDAAAAMTLLLPWMNAHAR